MFKTHVASLEIKVPSLKTTVSPDIGWKNITEEIQTVIQQSHVRRGIVVIQSQHTTAGVVINEAEEGLVETDLPQALARFFPRGREYAHDRVERLRHTPGEPENAHAHLQCIFATPGSVALIIEDARLALGEWQSVLFVDFDPHDRPIRTVRVMIVGDTE
ncbi:MAG: secondary thiamine-phosphate synthase enzyme YjbQ [Patescibacteria group bacterium]